MSRTWAAVRIFAPLPSKFLAQQAHLLPGAACLAHAARHARIVDGQAILEAHADAVELQRQRHVDQQVLHRPRQQDRDLRDREAGSQPLDHRAQLLDRELDRALMRLRGLGGQQAGDLLAHCGGDQRIVLHLAADRVTPVLIDAGHRMNSTGLPVRSSRSRYSEVALSTIA